jgi:hypothetical protein
MLAYFGVWKLPRHIRLCLAFLYYCDANWPGYASRINVDDMLNRPGCEEYSLSDRRLARLTERVR